MWYFKKIVFLFTLGYGLYFIKSVLIGKWQFLKNLLSLWSFLFSLKWQRWPDWRIYKKYQINHTCNLDKKVENVILTNKTHKNSNFLVNESAQNRNIQIAPLLNTHWHYIGHVAGIMKSMNLHHMFKSKLKTNDVVKC